MNQIKFVILVLVALTANFFSTSANAGLTPVAIAIIPPAQFPPTDFTVVGARVSAIWGQQRYVYGFDLGLVGNITEQGMGGVAVSGIFNYNRGVSTILGLQAAGVTNYNRDKATILGLQVAAGINTNVAESTVVGIQLAGLANMAQHTKVIGAQVGLYNEAGTVYGFQIGLYNSARSLHGIQIGLMNHNASGPFSYAPVINVGF